MPQSVTTCIMTCAPDMTLGLARLASCNQRDVDMFMQSLLCRHMQILTDSEGSRGARKSRVREGLIAGWRKAHQQRQKAGVNLKLQLREELLDMLWHSCNAILLHNSAQLAGVRPGNQLPPKLGIIVPCRVAACPHTPHRRHQVSTASEPFCGLHPSFESIVSHHEK